MRLSSLRVSTLPFIILASLGAIAVGCDGGGGGGGAGGAAAADCSAFDAVGEAPSCESLCSVANEEFCGGVATSPDCSDLRPGAVVDVCGVALQEPSLGGDLIELDRSPNVEEFAGSGAPDLSCYSPSGFPDAPGTSEMVTMQGIAKIFSHGCESKNLEISVFEVIRDGSADDGKPGAMVGSTVMTDEDCTVAGVPEDNEDCTDAKFAEQRWECRYTYPDVPTETELMVVTEGQGWAPLYEYNLYIPNDEVVDGAYEKDVRALAQDDYQLIPQTAMGKNIEAGNGAIGGEVHDCGDVRLINAIVDIDQPRALLSYFTDDETAPLPDVNAKATGTLGLYAALDVPPGPFNIAAAGVIDGQLVGVGFFKARVFANAVTSVTFRGLRPFQLE